MKSKSPIVVLLLAAAAITLIISGPVAAQPFRFVTTCDAQGNSESSPDPGASFGYVVSRINALSPRPDFWIFGGDAFYSADDSADAMAHWQTWKDDAGALSDIPLYLAIGNHDVNNYGNFYSTSWSGDGTGPFRASWPGLPQNGPDGYKGTAYAFRYGNSLFCLVNTNMYDAASYSATYKVDAAQRAWLSAVLDTTSAAHKFVVGHVEAWPPSNSESSSLEWNPSDRDSFWQVMTSRNVEAYICGHVHLWNRDFFAASGYGNPPASTVTRQVICGGAGGSLVDGYGGKFYHFVVWDIDGSSVTARVIDSYGVQQDSFGWSAPSGAGGNCSGTVPTRFKLLPARPNPSPGRSVICYRLFEEAKVNLDVYNLAGQKVATLLDETMPAGYHQVIWDARTMSGGVYLYRLKAGFQAASGKLTVIN